MSIECREQHFYAEDGSIKNTRYYIASVAGDAVSPVGYDAIDRTTHSTPEAAWLNWRNYCLDRHAVYGQTEDEVGLCAVCGVPTQGYALVMPPSSPLHKYKMCSHHNNLHNLANVHHASETSK